MRRALRLGLSIIGVVIGLPLCALLAAYLFLQTDSGKSWLADALSRQLSTPDSPVTVVGVTGDRRSTCALPRSALAIAPGPGDRFKTSSLRSPHGRWFMANSPSATCAPRRLPSAGC